MTIYDDLAEARKVRSRAKRALNEADVMVEHLLIEANIEWSLNNGRRPFPFGRRVSLYEMSFHRAYPEKIKKAIKTTFAPICKI
jgi:hypothetical protein